MNQITPPSSFRTASVRHDGWTPERKALFLSLLAQHGNVRFCARRCGMSAQAAYVLRRRDAPFAQGWAGALLLARDHAEQVLADRAIEGVEEIVFYRGEQVGTRRRYDTRLLLAHLGRLDRLEADKAAEQAAGRFDELLAIVAGERVPGVFGTAEDGPWPPERETVAMDAAADAQLASIAAHAESPDRFDPGAEEAADAALVSASNAASAAAGAEWDGWFARACGRVDALREDEGEDCGPTEFKSLDTVNSVNFAAWPWPLLDFSAPLRHWPAPTGGLGLPIIRPRQLAPGSSA